MIDVETECMCLDCLNGREADRMRERNTILEIALQDAKAEVIALRTKLEEANVRIDMMEAKR